MDQPLSSIVDEIDVHLLFAEKRRTDRQRLFGGNNDAFLLLNISQRAEDHSELTVVQLNEKVDRLLVDVQMDPAIDVVDVLRDRMVEDVHHSVQDALRKNPIGHSIGEEMVDVTVADCADATLKILVRIVVRFVFVIIVPARQHSSVDFSIQFGIVLDEFAIGEDVEERTADVTHRKDQAGVPIEDLRLGRRTIEQT